MDNRFDLVSVKSATIVDEAKNPCSHTFQFSKA